MGSIDPGVVHAEEVANRRRESMTSDTDPTAFFGKNTKTANGYEITEKFNSSLGSGSFLFRFVGNNIISCRSGAFLF